MTADTDTLSKNSVRAAVYVDGFDLYFGMRAAGLHGSRWLNVFELAGKLGQDREVVSVNYYAADVKGGGGKSQRQRVYLAALAEVCPDLRIVRGKYQERRQRCPECDNRWTTYGEKMTDVRIAVDIVTDAWSDQFDVAIVVTADSDLIPAIEAVRSKFGTDGETDQAKGAIVAFPPQRQSRGPKIAADDVFDINPSLIENSQLPPIVPREGKPPLTRPERWTRRN